MGNEFRIRRYIQDMRLDLLICRIRLYALAKIVSEQIAGFYSEAHAIETTILRPGNYTRLPDLSVDFLANRLRREDTAQLVFRCVDYAQQERLEVFNVLAGNPFFASDLDDYQLRPRELLERYYPGAFDLLLDNGIEWQGGQRIQSCAKAVRLLAYQPEFTFERYMRALGWSGVSQHQPV